MLPFLGRRLRSIFADGGIAFVKLTARPGFLQNNALFSFRSVSTSLEAEKSIQKQSFVMSYLVNSCGLSSQAAKSASKHLHFETPVRPDSFLGLLKKHGFSNAQISKVVRACPTLLLSKPERISAKFEFFLSIGASSTDVSRIFSSTPNLLRRSLKNHLIPCYDFLKRVLVHDEKVLTALRCSGRSLDARMEELIVPNIMLLRDLGVPERLVRSFLTTYPSVASIRHSKFCKLVEEVKGFGFEPSKLAFLQAISTISRTKKSTWDSKIQAYGKWGLSQDEVLSAFRRNPLFMSLSEEKINKVMEFLVNKMGWPAELIARSPIVPRFSLSNRIVPRCSVVQALLSKRLIKEEDLHLSFMLVLNEKDFLRTYVTRYKQSAPQLLDLYMGKLGLQ